ncbi:hypothetical protein B0H11DRAFT_2252609 [Mycena galericulata]|nr:hypothetical protein B0H11DRAFT_2252609 [Mycena galericulata]
MLRTVEVAVIAIQSVLAIELPPETADDLWARVWTWIQFIQIFREFLCQYQVELPNEENLCLDFLAFSQDLCEYAPNEELILSSTGLQALAVRAWVCALSSGDLTRQLAGLAVVLPFLSRVRADVHEMAEGAGGTLDELAALVMITFGIIAADGDASLSERQVEDLDDLLLILRNADGVTDLGNPDYEGTKHLCLALISQGFVGTLTLTARSLGHTPAAEVGAVIQKCMELMAAIFITQPGYRELRVAVQHGLLHVILAFGKRELSGGVWPVLYYLLTEIVSPSTVYYHVLADLETAYFAVTDGGRAPSFCYPELSEAWSSFSQTLIARLDVLRAFDSKDYISLAACDNVEEKKSFRRCSGCRHLFYCSRKCQTLDWRRGHRNSCALYRTRNNNVNLTYTSRERAFMRALVHHDYKVARTHICSQLVSIWATQPDETCFTIFDYRFPAVRIKVHTMDAALAGGAQDRYWVDFVERASRSSGRMSLDIVLLREGSRARDWIIPLRRETSEVHDMLKQTASSEGTDPIQMQQMVDLVKYDNVCEIH